MWLWHAPTLCDAASQSVGIHRIQTLSLLAMGGAFWWPILAPGASRRLPPLAAMVYLFTACIACTILGVVVTFSPVAVCSIYVHPVDRLGVLPLLREGWGLGPKADQEIGGLMMWVPACLIYSAAILAMLGRYYREGERAPGESA
jgi:cytochrome c oxidase assembly factor CtaG